MSNTPYLTQEKRDYICKHDIENVITVSINNMMRDEPSEPFSYLSKHFSSVHKE